MKNRLLSSFAVLSLVLAGTFSVGASAQTTQEGPGPSDQPSSPMEMGQGESAPPPPPTAVYRGEQAPPDDEAQPGEQPQAGEPSIQEAQPGGPSGEEPAKTNQGVGRISMIHGDVSTQPGDSADWSAAGLN